MSNIAHVRFAADQLAWHVYNHKPEQSELNLIIKQIVVFHTLDISPRYFDMVCSLAEQYYQDITSNRSVEVVGD